MDSSNKLKSLYRELISAEILTVFVVPLIRYNYQKSDYLYLLYKDLIDDPEYIINDLSFWGHIRFCLSPIRNQSTVLHYHWFECVDFRSLGGMFYKVMCIALYKLFGGKLVWTAHNKMPHTQKMVRLNRVLRRWMARRADLIHIHCSCAIPEISSFLDVPEGKFRVVEHPRFPTEEIDRETAITEINQKHGSSIKPDDTLFLIFGNISRYKQIDAVCKIFSTMEEQNKLIIVGPVKKGELSYYHKIKSIADKYSNIVLIPHFVPEKDVPLYYNSADCAIFNYRDVLTSGGVILAESYNLPMILPDKGCLQEKESEVIHKFSTAEHFEKLIKTIKPKEWAN